MFKSSVILWSSVLLLSSCGSTAIGQSKQSASRSDEFRILTHYDDPCVGDKGELDSYYTDGACAAAHGFKILQVVDDDNLLGQICVRNREGQVLHHYCTVWFKMSTKGMTDDKIYEVGTQWFEITGTKKYTSAIGASKTVLVAEPVERPKSEATLRKEAQEAAAAERRAAAVAELAAAAAELKAEREKQAREDNRTWTSASGKYTLAGTFVSSDTENVRLKKDDGTIITVALDKLSDEDQAWIEKRSKQ